jgi:hypothetical protein
MFLASCSHHEKITDMEHIIVPHILSESGEAAVEKCILRAAGRRTWNCQKSGQGTLICGSFSKGKSARIKINFSDKEYSIKYLGSENLDQEGDEISSIYNAWIRKLQKSIQKSMFNYEQ